MILPLDSLCEASGYIRLIVRATDGMLGKMQRESTLSEIVKR